MSHVSNLNLPSITGDDVHAKARRFSMDGRELGIFLSGKPSVLMLYLGSTKLMHLRLIISYASFLS
jgi:hypothetical protein